MLLWLEHKRAYFTRLHEKGYFVTFILKVNFWLSKLKCLLFVKQWKSIVYDQQTMDGVQYFANYEGKFLSRFFFFSLQEMKATFIEIKLNWNKKIIVTYLYWRVCIENNFVEDSASMFAWFPEISLESSCQLSFICNYLKNVFDQLTQWEMKNHLFPCIITVTLWLLWLVRSSQQRCSLEKGVL